MPLPIRTITSRAVVNDAEGTHYDFVFSDGTNIKFNIDHPIIKILQGLGLIT